MTHLDRITQDPAVMGGKACIRGLRVTVATIVGQIGTGRTIKELLADYPYLDREDILQALRTQPGWPKIEKSFYPAHEAAARHEPVASLDFPAL